MSAQYEDEDPPMTTKERAQEIKTQYTSRGTSLTSWRQFEQLFNNDFFIPELHYHECSEGFTGADVEKLLDLACEVELDTCGGFDGDHLYQCAPVHAINALLLLVASDRSLVDRVAQRMARRCAGTYGGENADFTLKCTGPCLIVLMHECGPPAVPYLVMAMRNLLFDVNLPEVSWLAASYVANAMRDIIYDCYIDIPLAISLTDQFCAPLLEFGRHPTASHNPVNKTVASHLLSELVEVAILITDEKEVLELCRSNKCYGDGWAHSWLDILRKFSLEPHPKMNCCANVVIVWIGSYKHGTKTIQTNSFHFLVELRMDLFLVNQVMSFRKGCSNISIVQNRSVHIATLLSHEQMSKFVNAANTFIIVA